MKVGANPMPAQTNTVQSSADAPVTPDEGDLAELGSEKEKQYYQDRFDAHSSTSQALQNSVSSQIGQFTGAPFSQTPLQGPRSTQAGADDYDVGPGWWGQGVTLARAQANLGSWDIGGPHNKPSLAGPHVTTSTNDFSQDDRTVAKGGQGADSYKIGISGGANVGNVEARAYNLFYSGSSEAQQANFDAPDVGTGLGGGGGIQARADLVDADLGVDLSGGKTTIGGEKVNNLVDASVMGQASVGVQGDAEGMAYVGNKGVGLGAGVSAFAGAQAGAFGQASIDGVGVGVLAQAWAGEGAKANLDVSYKNGKLTFDGGFGAALDVGGYVNIQATIDFDEIGKEIEGVAESGEKLGDKWDKSAGIAGKVAGDVVGTAEGAGKLVDSTAKAALNVTSKVLSGTGNVLNDATQTASKDITNAANDFLKKL